MVNRSSLSLPGGWLLTDCWGELLGNFLVQPTSLPPLLPFYGASHLLLPIKKPALLSLQMTSPFMSWRRNAPAFSWPVSNKHWLGLTRDHSRLLLSFWGVVISNLKKSVLVVFEMCPFFPASILYIPLDFGSDSVKLSWDVWAWDLQYTFIITLLYQNFVCVWKNAGVVRSEWAVPMGVLGAIQAVGSELLFVITTFTLKPFQMPFTYIEVKY